MRTRAVLLLISFFLLSCASANRSARGLEAGKINISYIPPFAASLRAGLSKNVEARLGWWLEKPTADLFLHTRNENGIFDFGLAGGVILQPFWYPHEPDDHNFYFSTVTISSRLKNRFFPYVTVSYFSDLRQNANSSYEISLGCETVVYRYQKTRNEIIVTPEIIWAPAWDTYPFNTQILGTIGLGFTFGLPK